MKFLEVQSSVVFIGEGFSTAFFQESKYTDILGEPDQETQVNIPVAKRQTFPETGYQILLMPDRMEFSYFKEDFFPEGLKKIAEGLVQVLEAVNPESCAGVGINLSVTIPADEVGKTGFEFCRENFLAWPDPKGRLEADEFKFNTSKLIYSFHNVLYHVDVEPHLASDGENLFVKMNAHQDVDKTNSIGTAINKFDEIREHTSTLHGKLLRG